MVVINNLKVFKIMLSSMRNYYRYYKASFTNFQLFNSSSFHLLRSSSIFSMELGLSWFWPPTENIQVGRGSFHDESNSKTNLKVFIGWAQPFLFFFCFCFWCVPDSSYCGQHLHFHPEEVPEERAQILVAIQYSIWSHPYQRVDEKLWRSSDIKF